MHISAYLHRQLQRVPLRLLDVATASSDGRRITAHKAITATDEFFQGHFPGAPLLPGVLMVEALTQASALLVCADPATPAGATVRLRGVDDAKFRRHVVPGDRLDLEVALVKRRGPIARVQATASVEGSVVIEAGLVLAIDACAPAIHPTAVVAASAVIGQGCVIGPGAVIGPYVTLGRDVQVGAHAVVEGDTTIGDGTQIFPFGSIGLAPQDLKYRGERTRLVVGRENVFRESVTIHRGTVGGGSETRIGDRNLFMAYAHVAHDCRVGSDTIFGPGATLGGHVEVGDFAQISAYSGVHQFCRVGRYAFIGGYSVVTKDALPYAKSVGNRARIYGLNTIGLVRKGFSPDAVRQLRQAYRFLLTSRLTPSKALAAIDADPRLSSSDVRELVTFIRSSKRGVTLRRPNKRAGEGDDE